MSSTLKSHPTIRLNPHWPLISLVMVDGEEASPSAIERYRENKQGEKRDMVRMTCGSYRLIFTSL
jgi:hypothetical protein